MVDDGGAARAAGSARRLQRSGDGRQQQQQQQREKRVSECPCPALRCGDDPARCCVAACALREEGPLALSLSNAANNTRASGDFGLGSGLWLVVVVVPVIMWSLFFAS